jgi:DNA-binding IclR family transcriptional regulator
VKPVELDLDAIPRRRKSVGHRDTIVRKTAWWRRIVRSLRMDGPQTVAALSKNLGIPEHKFPYLMEFFLKHGIVERVGRRYKLTEKHADYGKLSPRRQRGPRKVRPTAWSRLDELGD